MTNKQSAYVDEDDSFVCAITSLLLEQLNVYYMTDELSFELRSTKKFNDSSFELFE